MYCSCFCVAALASSFNHSRFSNGINLAPASHLCKLYKLNFIQLVKLTERSLGLIPKEKGAFTPFTFCLCCYSTQFSVIKQLLIVGAVLPMLTGQSLPVPVFHFREQPFPIVQLHRKYQPVLRLLWLSSHLTAWSGSMDSRMKSSSD
jgi:hypothetical protein